MLLALVGLPCPLSTFTPPLEWPPAGQTQLELKRTKLRECRELWVASSSQLNVFLVVFYLLVEVVAGIAVGR